MDRDAGNDAGERLLIKRALRPFLGAALGFGLVANLLLLVTPVYMLQIYDRVVTSGSYDALIWLTVIAIFLLGVYAAAEAGRRRCVSLAGVRFDDVVAPKLFDAFEARPDGGVELERNLARAARIRSLFQSGALLPFMDLPFLPLFLVALFLIHPLLGVIGLGGAGLVFAVALAAELSTRDSGELGAALEAEAGEFASGLARQRSAIVAMGLKPAAFARWRAMRNLARDAGLSASRSDNLFTGIARATRQSLQVGVLGAGAALALSQQISLGAIVAGGIILARALGPVDQIVAGWRQTMRGRLAWRELRKSIDQASAVRAETRLPRPEPLIELRRLAVGAPASEAPLIRAFSFKAQQGDLVAVLGGNGSGKTSLLQTLVGAWEPVEGDVILGGRAVSAWPSEDRGRHVGYVPQGVEILPGTVKQNIARFAEADDAAVFDAARRAAAHETILALPDGYDTRVGPGGVHLSAGQRQLLGLARALCGSPVLLVLDEPTANLDADAARTFLETIEQAARDGAIVIAATHDIRVVQRSSTVLMIRDGAIAAADAAKYLDAAGAKDAQGRTGT